MYAEFLWSADFFFAKLNLLEKKKYLTNSLDFDQGRQDVGPDLDLKCLQRLSVNNGR